jgi:hypothetical protein
MILRGDTGATDLETGASGPGRPTFDDLFRRAAVHDPDALALCDPPNRAAFTDGEPRRLTYAQADRAISALAAKFCRAGLQADTLVAIQLPNTVEAVVTLLAVLRAGMIAVPLPVLWRQKEMIAALRPLGVKAIVTASRIGAVKHAELAGEVGAELFPIRFICGFGDSLPDGVLTLDDVFDTQSASTVPRTLRGGQASEHVAVVTLDVTPSGLVPVARSHSELIAGGLALAQEAGVGPHMSILAAIPTSSFAGLAATLVPWLFGGGCLSLHHGFDGQVFTGQMGGPANMAIVPGPALVPLAKAGRLQRLQGIVALWRSPEQLNASPSWSGPARLIDVSCFGELGVIATPRDTHGLPMPMPLGPVGAPHDIETARSRNGTLLVRGAMVPKAAFPPGVEHGPEPYLAADKDGFVETGYTCRVDDETKTLTVSGPPGGIAAIGGYRFTSRALEDQVSLADPAATIVALPGGLMAQKLAGSALDNAEVAALILANGGNPLIAGAFRPRGLAA